MTPKGDWKERFLNALRRSPNVSAAARLAGYTRQRVYQLRDEDPDFAQAWDDALGQATDRAEGELYRRAVRGVTKKVYYQDKHIDTLREYSDTLLIFLLKSHKPGVYRETVRSEVTGKDGKDLIPASIVQPGYLDKLK